MATPPSITDVSLSHAKSLLKRGSSSISTPSSSADRPAAPNSHGKNHHRYKHWFRPKRWSIQVRRSSSIPLSTSVDTALDLKEQHKKDLEDLNAATWNGERRIALLDPCEINIELCHDADCSKRICDVASIELEHTAEYLQQEKYRLQLQLKSTNQVYSLKRIPPSGSARIKKKGLRLLVQEAMVLAKLGDHPNIISLRGLPFKSCSAEEFFILTDRLHPDTLETRIQQWQDAGKTAATAAWDTYLDLYGGDDNTVATPNDDTIPLKTNYALQIAKALQACHKAGVVVRDLSPQSIGFRQDDPNCIQLFDLGHAQEVEEDTSTAAKATLVGKRRYLAGEIWKTGQYSFKTDVYSWAMVYYEMCVERKPFLGYSVNEHQKYVWEKGDRPLLASCYLPAGIDKLLMRAWSHRPEERLDIDQVCHKTQALLMNMDSCVFWDQGESEYLFDIFVRTDDDDNDDAISALAEDIGAESLADAEVECVLEKSHGDLSVPEDDSEGKFSRSSSLAAAQPFKLISSAA